jgi:hypothetical protein
MQPACIVFYMDNLNFCFKKNGNARRSAAEALVERIGGIFLEAVF